MFYTEWPPCKSYLLVMAWLVQIFHTLNSNYGTNLLYTMRGFMLLIPTIIELQIYPIAFTF